MKKSIAIITERANIALGGAERSVFELSSSLRAEGFKVDILAAKGQSNTGNIHILCPRQSGKRASYAAFEYALREHLADSRYDIIHSVLPFEFADIYQPRGGTFAETIVRNAASYQNSFIGTYKKFTSFANFRRSVLLRAERNLCRDPAGPIVAALSKYVAEQFKRHYNLDDARIVVIHNGVRVKQVIADEADRLKGQILAHLSLKQADEPVFFLFAANNFRLKGLAVLLKAMHLADVKYKVKNAYLIVAGQGKSLKYRLSAKTLGIQKRVIFLGSLRHIQNALSISNVAVLPTFYDPSSRFILEAIAADKAVITTKYNGASDEFVHNRHGKIIDSPENIDALAEAIYFFADKNNIQKASDAILEDNLKDNVSITTAVKRLVKVYESILAKRRME